MSFEASLKIIREADDVTVAESEDVELWQYVLSQLSSEGTPTKVRERSTETKAVNGKRGEDPSRFSEEQRTESELGEAITKSSAKLGVDEDILKGACDPRLEPPYIHLDKHHWWEMKEELPSRGRNAIPSIIIAPSILAAWLEEAYGGGGTAGAEEHRHPRPESALGNLQLRVASGKRRRNFSPPSQV